MKIIYAILFFTDTIVLLLLGFLLFKFIDTNTNLTSIILLISGIIISIALLVCLLINYLNIPPSDRHD